MAVPPRQPVCRKLVYTAFPVTSGCDQQGLAAFRSEGTLERALTADRSDRRRRSYEPIIRINSQSGKGGVAYILEQFYGLLLPKPVQQAFSQIVTAVSDRQQRELKPDEIHQLFQDTYVNLMKPLMLTGYKEEMIDDQCRLLGDAAARREKRIGVRHRQRPA